MKEWIAMVLVLLAGTGLILAEKKTLTVTIAPMEGKAEPVSFNPTEVSIEKSVPWEKQKSTSQQPGEEPVLAFTSVESTTLYFETAFDTTSTNESVHRKYVEKLEKLAQVDDQLKRPPKVKVVWGNEGFSGFEGVINSIGTRYTMFHSDGTPVRATTNISLKSASKATTKTSEDEPEN